MEHQIHFCTGCGKSIPNGLAACPYCGKPVVAQPTYAPQQPPMGQVPPMQPGYAPMYVPAPQKPKDPKKVFHFAMAITFTVFSVLLLLLYLVPFAYVGLVEVEAEMFPVSMIVYLLSLVFLPLYMWLKCFNIKAGGKSLSDRLPMSIPVAIIAAFTIKWLDSAIMYDSIHGDLFACAIFIFILFFLMNAYGIVAVLLNKKWANAPAVPAVPYMPQSVPYTPAVQPVPPAYTPANAYAPAYAAPAAPYTAPAQPTDPATTEHAAPAVQQTPAPSAPAPATVAVAEESAAPAQSAFCTGCGKPLSANAAFCVYCGKPTSV